MEPARVTWFSRRPLTAYLSLCFAGAWSCWVPLALLYHGRSDVQAPVSSPLVIALQTLGVTAPLTSAVAVTLISEGKAGVRQLLGGLQRWRLRWRWFACSCLLVPVVTVLGVAVRAALGVHPAVPNGSALADMVAHIGWVGVALTFPPQLLGQCFGSPLLEEPGWRGFAFPRLAGRMSAGWAALLVGGIWGLWHVPVFIAVHDSLAVSLPLITMHGFILAWLYANTRSLLAVVLGHASLSVANNSLSLPAQGLTQIVLTALACLVIMTFFRFSDLQPRRAAEPTTTVTHTRQ